MAYPTTSFDFRDPMIGDIDGSHFYYPTAALAPQWQPSIPQTITYDEASFDQFSNATWATGAATTAFAPTLSATYPPPLPNSLHVFPSMNSTTTNAFGLKAVEMNNQISNIHLTQTFQPREIPLQQPRIEPLSAATKLFSCGRCGKQYCRKSTLKAHVKHHLGERPFICQICGKTFSQAANLTAHKRVHSGEKPFSCSICLRPFSQSSSLVTHKRTHTGERPYPCPHCDKAFTDSSTLTKHLRTHSGQKPYGCSMCNMRFSQSGNLHRHLKTHRIDAAADVKH